MLLKSTTKIEAGLLLLNRSNVDLLGGDVPELKSLWEKERMQIEVPAESSNNAPKWVSIDCYEVHFKLIHYYLFTVNFRIKNVKPRKYAKISIHSNVLPRFHISANKKTMKIARQIPNLNGKDN